ncbi:hypothetical protein ANN_07788 [Periplaneta americana]|uniref:Protein kinase domain-containing protein n=1 Tax=Periplaneta americana TaxID=6978 RepID=A0ABQ8SZK6_PERAM|nr:hypothetical protein ANN_07788 [Periplaneta americana]
MPCPSQTSGFNVPNYVRFDIIKKLGQGTYGKVQLGINKETGQEVAIKTIKKAKIETEADLVRIRREIQIMSSVQHPNIIHIYEVFENREKMVLVMEYAAGGELYDFLSERKVLAEEEARRIFRQIATAVYYCHKHKICHRDLKLENILLDEHGSAKIADFGLSNVFDEQRLLNTFCGSPLYASPEIVKGTPYHGPEVDCWSLGVLLYTLVYGAMPFDGSNFKRLVKQISQGDYFEPKKPSPAFLSTAASPLIREMLTVAPVRRADIEKICSHWWVNEGHTESCLDIAEELAAQTPVRLDLLLSLAPPPPAVGSDKMLLTDEQSGGDSRPVVSEQLGPARCHSVGSLMELDQPSAERRRREFEREKQRGSIGGEAKDSPKRKLEEVDVFVDFGDLTSDVQKKQLANHALVFMQDWIQPIAIYASRNTTPGDILAKILIQVILQLEAVGTRVVGFTCDGSSLYALRQECNRSHCAALTQIKDYRSGRNVSFLNHPSQAVYNVLIQTQLKIKEKISSASAMWDEIYLDALSIQSSGAGISTEDAAQGGAKRKETSAGRSRERRGSASRSNSQSRQEEPKEIALPPEEKMDIDVDSGMSEPASSEISKTSELPADSSDAVKNGLPTALDTNENLKTDVVVQKAPEKATVTREKSTRKSMKGSTKKSKPSSVDSAIETQSKDTESELKTICTEEEGTKTETAEETSTKPQIPQSETSMLKEETEETQVETIKPKVKKKKKVVNSSKAGDAHVETSQKPVGDIETSLNSSNIASNVEESPSQDSKELVSKSETLAVTANKTSDSEISKNSVSASKDDSENKTVDQPKTTSVKAKKSHGDLSLGKLGSSSDKSSGVEDLPSPTKPVERRRSKIFENADKFNIFLSGSEPKSPTAEKPKKVFIPGVKVSDYKQAFERRSSLTSVPLPSPVKSSISKKSVEPSTKSVPSKSSTTDNETADVPKTIKSNVELSSDVTNSITESSSSLPKQSENNKKEEKISTELSPISDTDQSTALNKEVENIHSDKTVKTNKEEDSDLKLIPALQVTEKVSHQEKARIKKLKDAVDIISNAIAEETRREADPHAVKKITSAKPPVPNLSEKTKTKSAGSSNSSSPKSPPMSPNDATASKKTIQVQVAPNDVRQATVQISTPHSTKFPFDETSVKRNESSTLRDLEETNKNGDGAFEKKESESLSMIGDSSQDASPAKKKSAKVEITLKSATLPRRKTSKAEIQLGYPPASPPPSRLPESGAPGEYRTEVEHMVGSTTPSRLQTQRSEVAFPVAAATNVQPSLSFRSASLEPEGTPNSKNKPREHIIPIRVEREPAESSIVSAPLPAKPPVPPLQQQRSMSQRSSSLSRQSTQDSDTDSTISASGPEPIRKSPREYIIPIAVEGGGYVTPRAGSLEPSVPEASTEASRQHHRSSGHFGKPRRMSGLLSDSGASEDEGFNSLNSPFATLHRHNSLGKDEADDDRPFHHMHRLRSSRPRPRPSLDHNDSMSSAEEEDDDDDGFEILTAESLFSTLLSRVRSLTQRLNVEDGGRPGFPTSRLMSHLTTGHGSPSSFWSNVYGRQGEPLSRVFENKVLRKIFGAKRDEVTGEWRKLHNTELHALYSSPDIIRNIKSRRLRWAGHVARMGESRNAYRVLVGRPEGKRPLGRPRRRWEDNIKMDLREVGYDDRNWINLAQDRDRWRAYVRAAMNLRALKPNEYCERQYFCVSIEKLLNEDDEFLGELIVTHEATSHLSGKVNTQCSNFGLGKSIRVSESSQFSRSFGHDGEGSTPWRRSMSRDVSDSDSVYSEAANSIPSGATLPRGPSRFDSGSVSDDAGSDISSSYYYTPALARRMQRQWQYPPSQDVENQQSRDWSGHKKDYLPPTRKSSLGSLTSQESSIPQYSSRRLSRTLSLRSAAEERSGSKILKNRDYPSPNNHSSEFIGQDGRSSIEDAEQTTKHHTRRDYLPPTRRSLSLLDSKEKSFVHRGSSASDCGDYSLRSKPLDVERVLPPLPYNAGSQGRRRESIRSSYSRQRSLDMAASSYGSSHRTQHPRIQEEVRDRPHHSSSLPSMAKAKEKKSVSSLHAEKSSEKLSKNSNVSVGYETDSSSNHVPKNISSKSDVLSDVHKNMDTPESPPECLSKGRGKQNISVNKYDNVASSSDSKNRSQIPSLLHFRSSSVSRETDKQKKKDLCKDEESARKARASSVSRSTPDRSILSKFFRQGSEERESEEDKDASKKKRRISRFLRPDFFDTPREESVYAKEKDAKKAAEAEAKLKLKKSAKKPEKSVVTSSRLTPVQSIEKVDSELVSALTDTKNSTKNSKVEPEQTEIQKQNEEQVKVSSDIKEKSNAKNDAKKSEKSSPAFEKQSNSSGNKSRFLHSLEKKLEKFRAGDDIPSSNNSGKSRVDKAIRSLREQSLAPRGGDIITSESHLLKRAVSVGDCCTVESTSKNQMPSSKDNSSSRLGNKVTSVLGLFRKLEDSPPKTYQSSSPRPSMLSRLRRTQSVYAGSQSDSVLVGVTSDATESSECKQVPPLRLKKTSSNSSVQKKKMNKELGKENKDTNKSAAARAENQHPTLLDNKPVSCSEQTKDVCVLDVNSTIKQPDVTVKLVKKGSIKSNAKRTPETGTKLKSENIATAVPTIEGKSTSSESQTVTISACPSETKPVEPDNLTELKQVIPDKKVELINITVDTHDNASLVVQDGKKLLNTSSNVKNNENVLINSKNSSSEDQPSVKPPDHKTEAGKTGDLKIVQNLGLPLTPSSDLDSAFDNSPVDDYSLNDDEIKFANVKRLESYIYPADDSSILSPADESESFDSWSVCSDFENREFPTSPIPSLGDDAEESVGDRIRRKSFYSRFNDIKKKHRKSSLSSIGSLSSSYRDPNSFLHHSRNYSRKKENPSDHILGSSLSSYRPSKPHRSQSLYSQSDYDDRLAPYNRKSPIPLKLQQNCYTEGNGNWPGTENAAHDMNGYVDGLSSVENWDGSQKSSQVADDLPVSEENFRYLGGSTETLRLPRHFNHNLNLGSIPYQRIPLHSDAMRRGSDSRLSRSTESNIGVTVPKLQLPMAWDRQLTSPRFMSNSSGVAVSSRSDRQGSVAGETLPLHGKYNRYNSHSPLDTPSSYIGSPPTGENLWTESKRPVTPH